MKSFVFQEGTAKSADISIGINATLSKKARSKFVRDQQNSVNYLKKTYKMN